MKNYNVAIVGCGTIHTLHAEALAKIPNVVLKASVDILSEKAEATAKIFNCASLSNFGDLLKIDDIDVIHLCTPHYLHAPMAIQALNAGKHVLTEKPMGISITECEEMIKTAKTADKILGICFQNRYNPTTIRIKELLESGNIGKPLGAKAFVTWFRDIEYYTSSTWRGKYKTEGGGLLINQAIHTLDLIMYFLGTPKKIKGNVDTRSLENVIEVEDTAEATINFANGVQAHFFATNGYPVNSPIVIELICEKAVLHLSNELKIQYEDGTVEVVSDLGSRSDIKSYWGYGHQSIIEDFYKKLDTQEAFPVSGVEGIKSIKLINAIYESSKTREWVHF